MKKYKKVSVNTAGEGDDVKSLKPMPLFFSILLFVGLVFVIYFWMKPTTPAVEAFSKDEAIKTVQNLYGGKILNIEDTDKKFIVQTEQDKGTYEVTIDKQTGNIEKLQLIAAKKDAGTPSQAETTPLPESEIRSIVQGQTAGMIESVQLNIDKTNQPVYQVEVIDKHQKQVFLVNAINGEILTKKEQTEEKNNDQPKTTQISQTDAERIAKNYLNGNIDNVELESDSTGIYYIVEIETANDEAEIQIDAISGKILSVTWDDEDE